MKRSGSLFLLINLLTTNTLNWIKKQVKEEDETNGRQEYRDQIMKDL